MAADSPETRKALGIGVFYVLGGLLAIVGWPPIVPSVLLGSGIALMVYHFLGGVDAGDRINWSLGQKMAVQVGGASVSLLVFSFVINHFLMEWQKDQLSSDPDLEDVLVLGRDGLPVRSLKLKRGNEVLPVLSWPKPDSPRTLEALPLTLDLDQGRRHILVRPGRGRAAEPFAFGYLPADYSVEGIPPLAGLVQRMIERDFFNPTLVQIRSQICAGANCPVSVIGFPLTLLSSSRVRQGEIHICYHRQDFAVGETFAPAAAGRNPSLLIQALAIAATPDSPAEAFRTFPIRSLSTVETTPGCRKAASGHAVIGLLHPGDLRGIAPQGRSGPITVFATNSANP